MSILDEIANPTPPIDVGNMLMRQQQLKNARTQNEGAQLENQTRTLQNQQLQNQINNEQAIRTAYAGAITKDANGNFVIDHNKAAQALAQGGNAHLVPQIQQSLMAQREAAAKLSDAELKNQKAIADQYGARAGAILSAPPEQQGAMYAQELAAEQKAGHDVSGWPPQWGPEAQTKLQGLYQGSISASDQMSNIIKMKDAKAMQDRADAAKQSAAKPTEASLAVDSVKGDSIAKAAMKALANQKIASRPPVDTSAKEDARLDKSYQYNNSQLVKIGDPIEQLAQRMGRLKDTLTQATPQADALVAPELMTVMAGGMGSGLRLNEAEISRVVGGRSQWESLKASLNKFSTDPAHANSITPSQRQQMNALIDAVGSKLVQKRQIIEEANQQLIGAGDVNEHRSIVANTRKKLADIDAGVRQAPPGLSNIHVNPTTGEQVGWDGKQWVKF